MTLQQIRCIVEVYRQQLNITAASRVLHMTQPGVSHHLKLFEEKIGVRVFGRTGTSISHVTPAGKAIIAEAEQILNASQRLQELARSLSNPTSGMLAIGTTPAQARYRLPEVVSRFVGAYPGVQLELQQGAPQQIAEMAISGEVDMVIATAAIESFELLAALPCYSWDYSILMPCDHPLAHAGEVALHSLAHYPLITCIDGDTGRSSLKQAFAAQRLTPNIVVTAADADTIKSYVRQGIGIGIVAAMAYDPEIDTDLCALDGTGLFPAGITRLGLRRDSFQRRYGFDFIEYFAPHLERELVEQAVMLKSQAAIDALFADIPHFEHRSLSRRPLLATA
jgi:LysR family cys regulon transcriptional activator